MHGFVEHALGLFVKGMNERWVCLRVQKSAGHDLVEAAPLGQCIGHALMLSVTCHSLAIKSFVIFTMNACFLFDKSEP
jgi:hypothetical protein